MEAFHNDFLKDSKSERKQRLRWIQNAAAETITMLDPPDELAAWMQTCMDEFDEVSGQQHLYKIDRHLPRRTATHLAVIAKQKYKAVKGILATIFAERPEILEECGLHLPIRRDRAGILRQCGQLLEVMARLAAAGEPDLPKPALLGDLAAAVAEAEAEAGTIEDKRGNSVRTQAAYRRRFMHDAGQLKLLLALWRAAKGYDDGLITVYIGCYNAKPRRAGMPDAPGNVRLENGSLAWDAPARSTSFRVQYAPPPPEAAPVRRGKKPPKTRINWRKLYQGDQTECAVPPLSARGWIVRVAARNMYGFGAWSEEIRI